MGQSSISIRVDDALKKNFDSLCEQVGLTTTAAFTVFMKAAVRERRIPFELKADTHEATKAKALASFYNMRRCAEAAGLNDMTLDEINAEIRAYREGK
ncbi:MAG: type II toxin-antitoxin system RelB/DinJ family antitoxin [Candidatus Egerieousia sp.]